MNNSDKPSTQPLHLASQDGVVVILGPDGLNGTMTPEAAEESASLLLKVAEAARAGQDRRFDE